MLTLSGVSKGYGGHTLFTDASLWVNRGDRIGLVGANGVGKSTLFSLILGDEKPDAGSVALQRGHRLGFLPQESAPPEERSVLDLATSISPEFVELRRARRTAPGPAEIDTPIGTDAIHRFEELDGHRVEAKAYKILSGLGFRETDFDRPLNHMSGGWVMRAHLARLLVQEPDLLLLDEPTNHLDLEALLWLQDYLQGYPGGILIISHDREFLNRLVDSVVEISQGRLLRYRGNFDDYLEERQARGEQHEAAFKNQQREIARLQRFVDRFRAKNTKAAQAQSKLKQIERMEKIEAPTGPSAALKFKFPQPGRSGLKVVTLQGIRQAYGDHVVYRELDFEAERGQRTVLVGPNGAGKSTLLKLLAHVIDPQQGTRRLGYQVKAGYYSQYRVEMLDPDRTVLEEALATPQPVTELSVRTVLGTFLFHEDDVFKRVKVLSGGEKSRLALVKLLLDPPNLLLMDEPTTHLDITSTDALLQALKQFEGTIVFISHDVYFIRELANHVVRVSEGRLTHYPGGYDYYLEKTRRESGPTAELKQGGTSPDKIFAPPRPAEERRRQKRLEAERRQERSRRRRGRKAQVERLEKEIAALESEQADLTAAMEDPSTYEQPGRAVELNQAFAAARDRLKARTAEWEEAATDLAALDAEA